MTKLTSAFAAFLLSTTALLAQDGDGEVLDVDIDVNSGPEWYENYWVWIGLALFVIILVALTRRPAK